MLRKAGERKTEREGEKEGERDSTKKKIGNEWSWEGGKDRNQLLKNSYLATSKS